MINILHDNDDSLKKQIEFLLGAKIKLSSIEVNELAHATVGNEWVLKVLDKLGLSVDDILYENDRRILMNLQNKHT